MGDLEQLDDLAAKAAAQQSNKNAGNPGGNSDPSDRSANSRPSGKSRGGSDTSAPGTKNEKGQNYSFDMGDLEQLDDLAAKAAAQQSNKNAGNSRGRSGRSDHTGNNASKDYSFDAGDLDDLDALAVKAASSGKASSKRSGGSNTSAPRTENEKGQDYSFDMGDLEQLDDLAAKAAAQQSNKNAGNSRSKSDPSANKGNNDADQDYSFDMSGLDDLAKIAARKSGKDLPSGRSFDDQSGRAAKQTQSPSNRNSSDSKKGDLNATVELQDDAISDAVAALATLPSMQNLISSKGSACSVCKVNPQESNQLCKSCKLLQERAPAPKKAAFVAGKLLERTLQKPQNQADYSALAAQILEQIVRVIKLAKDAAEETEAYDWGLELVNLSSQLAKVGFPYVAALSSNTLTPSDAVSKRDEIVKYIHAIDDLLQREPRASNNNSRENHNNRTKNRNAKRDRDATKAKLDDLKWGGANFLRDLTTAITAILQDGKQVVNDPDLLEADVGRLSNAIQRFTAACSPVILAARDNNERAFLAAKPVFDREHASLIHALNSVGYGVGSAPIRSDAGTQMARSTTPSGAQMASSNRTGSRNIIARAADAEESAHRLQQIQEHLKTIVEPKGSDAEKKTFDKYVTEIADAVTDVLHQSSGAVDNFDYNRFASNLERASQFSVEAAARLTDRNEQRNIIADLYLFLELSKQLVLAISDVARGAADLSQLRTIKAKWIEFFKRFLQTLHDSKSAKDGDAPICAGCNKEIASKYNVVSGKSWHTECMRCAFCKVPLKDGAYFDVKGEMGCEPCARNQLSSTKCTRCKGGISGPYYSCGTNKFHKECFVCNTCGIAISGSFYPSDNFPYCPTCGANK
eukprot:TRINITY_DN2294_c0_g1_i1.p1 TRINITY_DN2294_c0_g1~~TRINITY_DN2294_c0_g1_i1.p1  ORF type:complete len:860 (+),score=173.45 TRINITY_DN2294_c0_g1_i1:1-2580(+)